MTSFEMTPAPGVCLIKEEFLVKDHERSLCAEHIAKQDLEKLDPTISNDNQPPSAKKIKLQHKNKLKGQNKERRKGDNSAWKTKREFCPDLTEKLRSGEDNKSLTCSRGETCKFQHDAQSYMASKPPDIGSHCYVFNKTGHCPWGISCRFGGNHLTEEGANITDDSLKGTDLKLSQVINVLDKETVNKLWKKRYNFDKSSAALKQTELKIKRDKGSEKTQSQDIESDRILKDNDNLDLKQDYSKDITDSTKIESNCGDTTSHGCDQPIKTIGSVDDTDEIRLRNLEKKQLNWKGLVYLSPLTTVGNLPFRRICVEYGADITCSEMALAISLLQGTREWSLVKRHPSEKIFGVQICGNNPMVMTKTAQLLEEQASIDFVDINLGCPIDALYQQGCGSGMMARKGILLRSCHSINSVLKSIPLTVKLRTGLACSTPLAHNLMPLFRSAGVSLATVHGRSREQRYTKNADWPYINECAKAAHPMPVFGNGDILSYEDMNKFLAIAPDCSGSMVGRGALIKPWIFQEIKEQRHIDISSGERFEIIKKYSNYGLEHWGSDTRGVETTRRFLLEWLSFLYRYVPLGLLERPPQAINQRPPVYRGRNDMETLLASANCSDWIKISEMLLGPVPEGFVFLPKHKSNAWK